MNPVKNLVITTIKRNNAQIHCCASPDDGERVNAQIIETANKLVIVDAMLMRPYASELREYAKSLGKPVDRVFVTHSHPDHWFGIEYFQDVDVYAFPETIEEIKMFAKIAMDFHRSNHGDLVTDTLFLPNKVITESEVTIDGVLFRLFKIVAAEDVFMLALDLPGEKTFIAQDLLYNKVHLFVGQRSMDGTLCFDGWIAALKQYDNAEYDVVLPGHGVPADISIIKENITNLEKVKSILLSSTGDNFVENVVEAFPDYGLRSMVEMSAYFLFQMK